MNNLERRGFEPVYDCGHFSIARSAVPTGWITVTTDSKGNISTCFVPDTQHEWNGKLSFRVQEDLYEFNRELALDLGVKSGLFKHRNHCSNYLNIVLNGIDPELVSNHTYVAGVWFHELVTRFITKPLGSIDKNAQKQFIAKYNLLDCCTRKV